MRILAPLIICTVTSDGVGGISTSDLRPTSFPENTVYSMPDTNVVEAREIIKFAAKGMIDGGPVNGSVYWSPGLHEVGADTILRFDKGSAMPLMPWSFSDTLAIIGLIGLVFAAALILVRRDIRFEQPPEPLAWCAARTAARLLPPEKRDEYIEEWTSWLQDLRANKVRQPTMLAEVLSIVLIAAPRLALTLRLFPNRTGGR